MGDKETNATVSRLEHVTESSSSSASSRNAAMSSHSMQGGSLKWGASKESLQGDVSSGDLVMHSDLEHMTPMELQEIQERVKQQEEQIQLLEMEIRRKTQMLEHLRRGLRSYKSLGMRKPSHSDRELMMRINDGLTTFGDVSNQPKFVRALVFDCGTSETKGLLYTYDMSMMCPVVMQEVHLKDENPKLKRPGVIEHINNGTWRENVVKKFSDLYLEATSTKTSNFQGDKHAASGLDFCIVGASAWARKKYDLAKTNKEKNMLMYELRESGLFPKIFAQADESSFELLATIFAFCMAQDNGMIPAKETFGGVLGSGGGSCQFTRYDATKRKFPAINVEIGNRVGRSTFVKVATKDLSDADAPLKAIDDWIAAKRAQIKHRLRGSAFRPVKGFIICISAQYYAAIEICKKLKGCEEKYGKFANKDDKTVTIRAADAISAAEAYVRQQKAAWRSMTTDERKKLAASTEKRKTLKDWALGIANVTLCAMFWASYLDPSATLCFKRDWVIGKERAHFRSTWSAGLFIDMLKRQKGVDLSTKFPIMRSVLEMIEKSRTNMEKRTTDFRLTHSKVALFVNDMVKSHIIAIPEMADMHLKTATAWLDETKSWIHELEERISKLPGSTKRTKAEGLQFAIKGKASLERKLDSSIAELLKMNSGGDVSYAPMEADIMRKIRDCLRYTIVIDHDIYYEGVREIERYLEERHCAVEAKNYWQDPPNKKDRQTMYMGLNMRIWLPSKPIADYFPEGKYPMELQVHTPKSYDLKNGKSHDIYEDIRTENVVARRDKLVAEAYELWECMPVPRNPKFDPVSFADYRGRNKTFRSEHKRYTKTKKKKNEATSGTAATKESKGPPDPPHCAERAESRSSL